MIIKELDEYFGATPNEKAGRSAEEQMAFYLKRRFYTSKDIYVLNNLRFKCLDGTFAQIDHLLLSRYGVIIVESKSVSTAVAYQSDGQWFRIVSGKPFGMPSPVQQAKNQGFALKELLTEHAEQLRSKFFLGLVQGRFGYMPVDVLVAVSDFGKILRPKKDIYPDIVMKADLIAEKAEALYLAYKKSDTLLTFSTVPVWVMPEKDLKQVLEFFKSIHEPWVPPRPASQVRPVQSKPPVQSEPPRVELLEEPEVTPVEETQKQGLKRDECPDCHGKRTILWGARYKCYYWHCDSCGKNSSIQEKCPLCNVKMKLRKQGNEYTLLCEACQNTFPYYVVPKAE